MTATSVRIEELATWSSPKRVETRNGPRNLRTANPSDKFWSAWRSSKETLRSAGVSVGKTRSGDWEACWWLPLDMAEKAKAEAAQEASRATDAAVDLPCPNGLAYLGYQKAGIAYALKSANVLFGDEMGLGKTIQAIGVFNADPSINRVIVICPASLRLNWKREFSKWSVRPVRIEIVNGGKPSDWPTTPFDVLVINYDVVQKHRARIEQTQWDLLIADEAHYLKNPKALRTKSVLGAKSKGEVKSYPINARRKLFLTGTPIVNRPVELWPLVESLDPKDLGKNFFGYAKRYCDAKQTRWGWDFSGASHLDELQRRLREKFLVRRLKADVLTELPAKRRQVIEIPANGAAGAVAEEKRAWTGHQAYIADLEERIKQKETEEAYELREMDHPDEIEALRQQLAHARSVAFSEMSKVRHAVAVAKIPHVIEHLEAALEEGPVVLFAHHKDVIAGIAEAFAGKCVTLTGETPMAARQQAVDDFQAGKIDLFLGNIQAAGVGITLTRSSHVVFAELDWVPGNLSQAEDRCHRIGQTQSVLVQHLVLEDSLDAEMARKLIAKQEVITAALDSQAPVNYGTESEVTEVTIKPEAIQTEAVSLTPEQVAAIHLGLRRLAGMCDGARQLDNCGFNRYDTEIGHSMASRGSLSPRQAVLGRIIALRYHKQLPEDLVRQIRGVANADKS